jgi:cation diffusion facilitator family transporter
VLRGGRYAQGVNATRATAGQAAGAALLVTCVLAVAKVAVWVATGSLAVLSQALDSVVDVVALSVVFVGVRVAAKPADTSHHYGHAKAENLVAFSQTVLLGLIVVAVVVEGFTRLFAGSPDVGAPWYALALLGASAAIDVFRARSLSIAAEQHRSDALKAGALNIATDVGTALVALVSLVAVRADLEGADALGALIVAGAVAVSALRLGKRSVDVLMDRAPGAGVQEIEAAATRASGVAETRRVRVRGAGDQLFADVTVAAGRTASLERAHDIAENVEREIARVIPGADVVVHVEPAPETAGLVERVQAAASRAEGVHEVHNVLVHAFSEGGRRKLHVTLHAKIRPGTSVGQAHELSDRIENAVAHELGTDVRVDTHIEPLKTAHSGRDVTRDRQDVVRSVRKLAVEEPDVLDCHEVIVTSAGGRLSVVAHVRGRGDLPMTRMHDASERIEDALRARHAEVGPVLIHFEPAN